jgi:hypothetical protein
MFSKARFIQKLLISSGRSFDDLQSLLNTIKQSGSSHFSLSCSPPIRIFFHSDQYESYRDLLPSIDSSPSPDSNAGEIDYLRKGQVRKEIVLTLTSLVVSVQAAWEKRIVKSLNTMSCELHLPLSRQVKWITTIKENDLRLSVPTEK